MVTNDGVEPCIDDELEGPMSCANLSERWVCIECGYTWYGELRGCAKCNAPEVQQLTIELIAKIKKLVIFDADNRHWSHLKIMEYCNVKR